MNGGCSFSFRFLVLFLLAQWDIVDVYNTCVPSGRIGDNTCVGWTCGREGFKMKQLGCFSCLLMAPYARIVCHIGSCFPRDRDYRPVSALVWDIIRLESHSLALLPRPGGAPLIRASKSACGSVALWLEMMSEWNVTQTNEPSVCTEQEAGGGVIPLVNVL